jgi:hypothetical protein
MGEEYVVFRHTSRQILELLWRSALQIRRVEGVDREGFPECPVFREDVVENTAGYRRVTKRNYARLAAGACRLDRLPNCDVEPWGLINHH